MSMVKTTAFANFKQNKGRNLLSGIAIALTALLIYSVLNFGFGMIKLQKEAVNMVYPTWHIMYRNVNENTVKALSMHADIEGIGLRADVARVNTDIADILLCYLDTKGYEYNKLELTEGDFPEEADDIVVSKAALKAMGLSGKLGDYINIPYQVYEEDGLGMEKQGSFKICGFLPDNDNPGKKIYGLLVSKGFMEAKQPTEKNSYRVMLHIKNSDRLTTDEIEEKGKEIAKNFGIAEGDTVFNNEYLWANYVDPSFNAGIAAIVFVIVLAGFLTIYSIYYVSMVHKVQEYGKLRALGASKRQLRQIVFWEGILVAALAIPAGMILGVSLSRVCFKFLMSTAADNNNLTKVMVELLSSRKLSLFDPRVAAAAMGISLLTVVISLFWPMRKAAKISAVEAMRYENQPSGRKKSRRGYTNLTLVRLAKADLLRNKKRTALTIITLGATGILFIIVATFLSCAKPSEIAKGEILSDFRISIESESGNAMHPERDWKNLQQHNPLSDSFEQKVLSINGVKNIRKVKSVFIKLKDYIYDNDAWSSSVIGLGEEFADDLDKGMVKGKVSYKELKKGEKIILSKDFLHWFPEVKVGDTIGITFENGDTTFDKKFIVGAIGDYSYAVTRGADFILPSSVIDNLCQFNMIYRYEITVDKNSYKEAAENLKQLVSTQDNLTLESYEDNVKTWEDVIGLMSKAGYIIMTILAGVGIMNLINTMINSVYARRRELAVMQAVGLSEGQLNRMLQAEGLFYTVGTLLLSFSIGSLAGYEVIVYARNNDVMNITRYHYPVSQTVFLLIIVFAIQILLSAIVSQSINKKNLIERIRVS